MNKLIFSLVLLGVYCFAFSSSFDVHAHFGVSKATFGGSGFTLGNCTKNGCAEYKESCTANCATNSTTNSNCCFPPLYCINGKCERHNIGAQCNSVTNCDVDLDGTLLVECLNSTCTELYGAGDQCTNSSMCVGNLTCTGGVCVGLGLGANCNPFNNFYKLSECAAPNYCNMSGQCQAPSTGSCLDQACNQTSVCNVYNSSKATCEAIASLTNVGAQASSPLLCASNLAWNTTACVGVPSGSLLVECTAGESDETTCTNAFGSNAVCVCSTYSGNAFCVGGNESYLASLAPTGASQALNLANCLAKYNCSYNGIQNQFPSGNPLYNANAAPNACSYVNCWSAYKKYMGQYCSDLEDVFGSCFYSPECGGFPVWAIVVIVIVAVILVLAVVIVIFLVLRRRKDYASI